jgi:hypothetical protein
MHRSSASKFQPGDLSHHWAGGPFPGRRPSYVRGKREANVTRDLSTIAPEIIACISEGRDPTIHELARVADRIDRDLFGARSVFAWDRDVVAARRMTSMRIALAALAGTSTTASPAMTPARSTMLGETA